MKIFCLGAMALGVAGKDIKQKMMENRLKFDRDIVIHGGDEGDEEWDPWDLEDEELQVNISAKRERWTELVFVRNI